MVVCLKTIYSGHHAVKLLESFTQRTNLFSRDVLLELDQCYLTKLCYSIAVCTRISTRLCVIGDGAETVFTSMKEGRLWFFSDERWRAANDK